MVGLFAVAVSAILGALLALVLPFGQLFFPILGLFVACLAAHRLSGAWVRTRPLVAVVLSPASALFAMVVIALSTYASVRLGLALPSWIKSADPDLAKAVTNVIGGVLSGLMGAFWLKEAQDSDSRFWPAGAYRAALRAAFDGAPILNDAELSGMELLYRAVNDDNVAPLKGPTDDQPNKADLIVGWGLQARWQRALIIATYDRNAP